MSDILSIAYAAGFQVEQFGQHGTCAVKRENGETRYGIPLDHFADIVKAAQPATKTLGDAVREARGGDAPIARKGYA